MINFDELVSRNTPEDIKYEKVEGITDLIPMWVADMDFKCPEEVSDALAEQSKRGIFGYSEADKTYDDAVVNWFKNRYGWDVDPKTCLKLPSVILALSLSIRALTEPGDAILIMEPLYGAISRTVKMTGRKLVVSELELKGSRYEIVFEDMEKKIKENNVKMFVLCNPHNPAGRVWTRDELLRMGDICLRNNVLIVSDEIHADFIYSGHRHIPIASLSEELNKITITCTSPTKTFNLAGIQAANVFVADDSMRRKIDQLSLATGAFGLNVMGIVATRAAYTYGDTWLSELITYLDGNVALVRSRLEGTNLKMTDIEGTYLLWIDASRVTDEDPTAYFLRTAHVRFSEGTFFGNNGKHFFRMNVACPRSILSEALDRILEVPGVR